MTYGDLHPPVPRLGRNRTARPRARGWRETGTAESTARPRPVTARPLHWCVVASAIPLTVDVGLDRRIVPLAEVVYAVVSLVLCGHGVLRWRAASRPLATGGARVGLRGGLRGATPTPFAAAVFLGALSTVTAVHFSAAGLLVLVQVFGAVAAVPYVLELLRAQRIAPFLRTVGAFVGAQFAVAMGQILRDGALVGSALGESEFGFRRIDGLLSPSGTLTHANVLGTTAALAATLSVYALAHCELRRFDRRLCAVTAVLGSALAALSLCRTAFLCELALLAVMMAAPHRRRLLRVWLAMLAAFVLCLGARADGWLSRADATAAGTEAAGSGRMALNRQALALFELDPAFGVGLGGYWPAIKAHPEIDAMSTEDIRVHNVVLYALAATGLVGTVALAVLGVAVADRLRRARTWGVGMASVAAPVLLLTPQMFTDVGFLWLALLIALGIAGPTTRSAGTLDPAP